jgi:hypothetical protein
LYHTTILSVEFADHYLKGGHQSSDDTLGATVSDQGGWKKVADIKQNDWNLQQALFAVCVSFGTLCLSFGDQLI